jgi:predicted  nucleic acid-binding Zn-ribbon protein
MDANITYNPPMKDGGGTEYREAVVYRDRPVPVEVEKEVQVDRPVAVHRTIEKIEQRYDEQLAELIKDVRELKTKLNFTNSGLQKEVDSINNVLAEVRAISIGSQKYKQETIDSISSAFKSLKAEMEQKLVKHRAVNTDPIETLLTEIKNSIPEHIQSHVLPKIEPITNLSAKFNQLSADLDNKNDRIKQIIEESSKDTKMSYLTYMKSTKDTFEKVARDAKGHFSEAKEYFSDSGNLVVSKVVDALDKTSNSLSNKLDYAEEEIRIISQKISNIEIPVPPEQVRYDSEFNFISDTLQRLEDKIESFIDAERYNTDKQDAEVLSLLERVLSTVEDTYLIELIKSEISDRISGAERKLVSKIQLILDVLPDSIIFHSMELPASDSNNPVTIIREKSISTVDKYVDLPNPAMHSGSQYYVCNWSMRPFKTKGIYISNGNKWIKL